MLTKVRTTLQVLLLLWLAVLLAGLPFVYSRSTYEWFDFTKQLVLFVWIAVGAVLLCLRSIADQRRPSWSLDRGFTAGLVLLAGSFFFSVLFSRSIWSSFFGSQGRIQGSALAGLGYLVLFLITFFAIRGGRGVRVLNHALVFGSAAQSAIAIGQRAGWHVFGIDSAGLGVGTLGSLSALALMSIAGAVTAVVTAVREPAPRQKAAWFAVSALCAAGVFLSGFESGWILVATSVVYLILVLPWGSLRRSDGWYLLGLTVFLFLGTLAVNTPWFGIGRWLSAASMLDLRAGWDGAANIARVYPFFGSGPETFSFMYPAFKPLGFNLGGSWNISFLYPFNEILSMLAHTGYVGIAAFFCFLYAAAKSVQVFKRGLDRDSSLDHLSWTAVWLVCVAYWFVSGSSVMAEVLFWVSLAISLAQRHQDAGQAKSSKVSVEGERQLESRFLLASVAGALVIAAVGYSAVQWLRADMAFTRQLSLTASAETTDTVISDMYEQAVKAVEIAPWNDRYLYSAGMRALALADTKKTKDSTGASVTMTDQALVLYDEASEYLRQSTEINPYMAIYWAGRAEAALGSAGDGQTPREAVSYYQKASILEPTNPQYYYALALIASQGGTASVSATESYLRLALNAKSDWLAPRYALAQFLESFKRYGESYQEYSILQQYLDSSGSADDDRKTIADALVRVKALIPETTSSDPSVPAGQ